MATRLFVIATLSLCVHSAAARSAPVPATRATQAVSAAPSAADAAAAQKSVRALINAIRYNKDAVAAKHLNFEGMARLLLLQDYDKASAAQRQQFVASLGTLVAKTSFPKGREMFHYLDALLFEAASQAGDTLQVGSVVVVHRNLKKVELPITWVLTRSQDVWQVVDIISMKESTAHGIREEEVLPLMQEGGMAKVLAAMQERLAQLPAATEAQAP